MDPHALDILYATCDKGLHHFYHVEGTYNNIVFQLWIVEVDNVPQRSWADKVETSLALFNSSISFSDKICLPSAFSSAISNSNGTQALGIFSPQQG